MQGPFQGAGPFQGPGPFQGAGPFQGPGFFQGPGPGLYQVYPGQRFPGPRGRHQSKMAHLFVFKFLMTSGAGGTKPGTKPGAKPGTKPGAKPRTGSFWGEEAKGPMTCHQVWCDELYTPKKEPSKIPLKSPPRYL